MKEQTTKMQTTKIQTMTIIGLMTAILCIFAPMTLLLPLTPIPFSLTPMFIYGIGAILGSRRGAMTVLLFLLIGAAGVPVFSGYQGGLPKLIGPTGGFLLGYLAAVWLVGWFTERFPNRIWAYIGSMFAGLLACYILGTLWFAFLQKISLSAAIAGAVLPFIPLDLLKIAVAVLVVYPLRNRFRNLIPAANHRMG